MKRKREIQLNKSGNQMVEAAIALPLVILSIMLLIRLFTFYLQILSTGISEHKKAIDACKAYQGSGRKIYESIEYVELVKGGLLSNTLDKEIRTKDYFYNEDAIVRSKYGLKK